MNSLPTEAGKVAVVVPVFNQWDMTLLFAESWRTSGSAGRAELLFVDNGSTDSTRLGLDALAASLGARVLRNARNLGVAPAWNQGVRWALESGAQWVGVLNNDLVLGPDWLPELLERALARGWALASPATREGGLDYDFGAYSGSYVRRCRDWDAEGRWFGWCFLVEAAVFGKVGLFDETFEVGGCEDEDFLRRFEAAGYRCGVSGCSFVHHFGSRTQNAVKREQGDAFGHANIARIRARYGPPPRRTPLVKLRAALVRLYQRVRWGHLLKE